MAALPDSGRAARDAAIFVMGLRDISTAAAVLLGRGSTMRRER
ncbi:MAG: hypothetical protein AB7S71_07925 [Dongiaceae bacterium]